MNNYRTSPQFTMPYDELIVDNFACGGGASTGIEQEIGRPVDIAINHDADAIAMHNVNHPTTKHYCEDVFDSTGKTVPQYKQVARCGNSVCPPLAEAIAAANYKDPQQQREAV